MTFEELLTAIQQRKITTLEECKDFLSAENIDERKYYILYLLKAFSEVHLEHQADQLAELAWYLGIKEHNVYNYLLARYQQKKLFDEALHLIREFAFKCYLDKNLFNLVEVFRTYLVIRSNHRGLGHLQDFIIKNLVKELVEPYTFNAQLDPNILNRKIKVGYVLWGDFNDHNNLTPICINFADHHNKDKFEIYLISYYPKEINNSIRLKQLKEQAVNSLNVKKIIECVLPLDISGSSTWESAYTLARQIYNEQLDVLMFQGQYPEHLLLTELRPAPICMGMTHGFPEAYTNESLDLMIDPNVKKVCIEELTHSAFIPKAAFFNFNLFENLEHSHILSKKQYGLENKIVLLSMGFLSKFNLVETSQFIQMMTNILKNNLNTIWMIVGIKLSDIEHYILDNSVKNRIIVIDKCFDYSKYYDLADIYVDTYPAPGGLNVYEALNRKLAGVYYKRTLDKSLSFKDKFYDVFGEILPSHLVVNADLQGIQNRIQQLIDNPALRKQVGEDLFNEISKYQDMNHYIQSIENVIINVIQKKLNHQDLFKPIKKHEYYSINQDILSYQIDEIRNLILKDKESCIKKINFLLQINVNNTDYYLQIIDILEAVNIDITQYIKYMLIFCNLSSNQFINILELLLDKNKTNEVIYFSQLYLNLYSQDSQKLNKLKLFLIEKNLI